MLLDSLELPAGLAGLSDEELAELATQIRTRIIDTVSATGGHLGSNLGATHPLDTGVHRDPYVQRTQ